MEARWEQINDIYFSLCKDLLVGVIGSRFFLAKEIYIPIGQKTGFMVTLWSDSILLAIHYRFDQNTS